MNALLFLAEGFEEIEAITIIDVLRRGDIIIDPISITESKKVHGANNIQVCVEKNIYDIESNIYDIVILPGGLEGVGNLLNSKKVKSILKDFYSDDKWIGAICAAPIVLHKAGILNKQYTCYPSIENNIRPNDWRNENVVIDKKIITSKGPSTSIDFSLSILERLMGTDISSRVKNELLY